MKPLHILCAFAVFITSPLSAAKWHEAETAHFIIKSRDSEEKTREVALQLERFDSVLRQMQNMPLDHEAPSRANKLTLYRFGDTEDIGRSAGAPGSGIAGFFIPRAGNSVSFTPIKDTSARNIKSSFKSNRHLSLTPEVVIKHEYTHYFMMQHFPGAYPSWYVEGFAEIMGTTRLQDDGSAHIGDPPQHRAYQIFQMRDFRLSEMLDSNHKLTGADSLQHYATGWLLAHYLSFDFDGPRAGQLPRYLAALAKGEDSLKTAEEVFGDLRKLEKELSKYKRGPFPGLRVPSPSGVDFWVKSRELTPVEADLMAQEMQLAVFVGKNGSKKAANKIRRKMADYPTSTHLLNLLAQAEYHAENYEEAEAVAARSVEIDPGNSIGWLVRADVAMEMAKDAEDGEASFFEKSRNFASQAAQADRNDPRPLITYYSTYLLADEQPTELAAIALEQAYEYAGTDAGYRVLLTRQMLLENQMDAARAVLLPVAFRGHKTGEPKDEDDPSMSRLLKLVNAGDRDAAIAMIDKMIDDEDEDDA